jgi:hypothetical protein
METQTRVLQNNNGGPSQTLAPEWRRWIAENLLLNNDPASIMSAMIRDGISPDLAHAELHSALEHPYLQAARQMSAKPPVLGAANLESKLKKRDWILDCYKTAARVSSSYGTVPRVPKLSRQAFFDDYYAVNRPVVIESAIDHWPALKRWNSTELQSRFGARTVEVQAGRTKDADYERNSTRLKQMMPFGDYIQMIDRAGDTNEWYMTANNSGININALKELWDDIEIPTEYLSNADPNERGFFWFGPAGTITPLHHDLTNNFMAQVRGSKLVRLIAPYELPRMYNDRHCYSQVDLTAPDLVKFPLFKDVTVVDVTINPGDLLFLPVGWWHYVRALQVSITMTFTNFVVDNDFYSFYSTYGNI